jgi:hypothetical protein
MYDVKAEHGQQCVCRCGRNPAVMAQMSEMRSGEIEEFAADQEPAQDGSEDDRGDGKAFHPTVGPDQLVGRQVLGEDAVLRRRVHRRAYAYHPIGQQRMQAEQHAQAAYDLDRVADEHDAALRNGIGKRADERREHDVREDEEHLQHRGLPAWRVQILEQGDRCKEKGVIGECGEELRRQDRVEAAIHPGCRYCGPPVACVCACARTGPCSEGRDFIPRNRKIPGRTGARRRDDAHLTLFI